MASRFTNPEPKRSRNTISKNTDTTKRSRISGKTIKSKRAARPYDYPTAAELTEDYSVFEDIASGNELVEWQPMLYFRAARGGQWDPDDLCSASYSMLNTEKDFYTGFIAVDKGTQLVKGKTANSHKWSKLERKSVYVSDQTYAGRVTLPYVWPDVEISYELNPPGDTDNYLYLNDGFFAPDFKVDYRFDYFLQGTKPAHINDTGGYYIPGTEWPYIPSTLKAEGWTNGTEGLTGLEGQERVTVYESQLRGLQLDNALDDNRPWHIGNEADIPYDLSNARGPISVSYNAEKRLYFLSSTWSWRFYDLSEWSFSDPTSSYTFGPGYNYFLYEYTVLNEELNTYEYTVSIFLFTGVTAAPVDFYPLDGFGGEETWNDYFPGESGWADAYSSMADANDESTQARVAGWTGAYYKKLVKAKNYPLNPEDPTDEIPTHAVMVVPLVTHPALKSVSKTRGWVYMEVEENINPNSNAPSTLIPNSAKTSPYGYWWEYLYNVGHEYAYGSSPSQVVTYYPTMHAGIGAYDDYSIGLYLKNRANCVLHEDATGGEYSDEYRSLNQGFSVYDSIIADQHVYTYGRNRVHYSYYPVLAEQDSFFDDMTYRVLDEFLGPSTWSKQGNLSLSSYGCAGLGPEDYDPSTYFLYDQSYRFITGYDLYWPNNTGDYLSLSQDSLPDIIQLIPYTNGNLELESYHNPDDPEFIGNSTE